MRPIFISYRRSDLSLEAEWIYNLICTFFGEDLVFFDKEKIQSGKRWDETLRTKVADANIVLILIGPKWLHEQSESGMRRLDDPEDWVRKEVIASIENYKQQPDKKWVIPVLLNNAKLPKKEWLPKELEQLALFQIERTFQFTINNYVDAALNLYNFIKDRLSQLKVQGLLKEFTAKSFNNALVPNPYDLTGYQLPVELRTLRPVHPFKGLEFFKREDARIFFGRQKETGEIIDHFRKSQHILRLYGQSGAGKSSLLYAGLFPRMEANGWIVRYFRRDFGIPLGESLWRIINDLIPLDDADALIILDQVEEIITNPNSRYSEIELRELAKVVVGLKDVNSVRKKHIRLMLSYRSEYDVDIKSALQEHGVSSNEYWLKGLDESGMREAIQEIMKDSELNKAYHVQIEKGIDDLIIKDLIGKRHKEDTTPLLQILLRKLWDRLALLDISNRKITEELYEDCKSNDLSELLKEQLISIGEKTTVPELKNAVESGLALDVLKQFTTVHNTISLVSEDAILQNYYDCSTVKKLLQAFVDAYLLVRIESNSYLLPHDTLAKTVRLQYNNSFFPGQRAAILLESKKYDIINNPDFVEFSKADLVIIDMGADGMRKLSVMEEKVIKASRQKIFQLELDLEEKNKKLEIALREAKKQALLAKAKALAANAREISREDPTLALRLAEVSCWLTKEPTKEARSALADIAKQNPTYYEKSINFKFEKDEYLIEFSPKNKYLLTGISRMSYALGTESYFENTDCYIRDFSGSIKAILKGHEYNVSKARFSPDESKVITSSDNELRLWDIAGNLLQTFIGHERSVSDFIFSPNERIIVSSSMDQTIRFWDLSGNCLAVLENPCSWIIPIAFSPDGSSLFSGSSSAATLWNISDVTIQSFIGHSTLIYSVAFSPNGKFVLTGGSDHTARVWDLSGNCLAVLHGHTMEIHAVTFSNDSRYILTGSDDKTARLWSTDGKCLNIFHHANHVRQVCLTSIDEPIFTESTGNCIRVWSFKGNIPKIFADSSPISSVCFSACGQKILSGSFDNTAKLMDLNGELIQHFKGHTGFIRSAAFSPDEKMVITGSADKTARLWDINGNCLCIFEGHDQEVESAVFSNNRKYIATGSNDKTIRIWDIQGNLIKVFEPKPIMKTSPYTESLVFSHNDQFIIGACYDGALRIWNLKTGKVKIFASEIPRTLNSVFLSPDGKFILTACSSHCAHLRDFDGNVVQVFQGHSDMVTSASFSGDGKYIVTTSFDRTARVWDLSGNTIQILEGHADTVNAASFSPDGKFIVTGSQDNTIRIWHPIWEILKSENIAIPSEDQMEEHVLPSISKWKGRWGSQ